tara:strand:- start:1759 stop:2325 length:567 start_codon:yes stop_codon:yes gene_type:complete
MAGVIDLYLAYRFLKNLVQPFEKWEAYKAGVIDKDGAILVPKQKRTTQQKDSFGYFDLISMNLKKLLGKLPGGQSAIASYAAALLLLKEYNKKQIKEDLNDYVDLDWLQKEFNICLAEAEELFKEEEEQVEEEGEPTNNVSSGAIAGVGVGSKGEPPVYPKNKYRANNEIDSKKIARRVLGIINGGKQ